MPRLNDNLEVFTPKTGTFGFSATRIADLEATEYTIVTVIVDTSSSVCSFESDLIKTIKEIVRACKFSPRADNLLIRLVEFNGKVNEIHGFKPLEQCNLDDYTNILNVGGMTALYDAVENGAKAMADYGRNLMKNDFTVNGILIVATDGENNHSTVGIQGVKKAMQEVLQTEALESMVSVLIGVGVDPKTSSYLSNFKDEVGFTQYVDAGEASPRKLAKLADFVSKSISAQSQSLGTGGPSQAIPQSLAI